MYDIINRAKNCKHLICSVYFALFVSLRYELNCSHLYCYFYIDYDTGELSDLYN